MDREQECQELDRAHREYAEVMERQQREEEEAAVRMRRAVAAEEARLRVFGMFLDKVF